jgi:hypothetical protein
VSFWRPLQRAQRKPWWDSDLAMAYGAAGLATVLIAKRMGHFFYTPTEYANDRDDKRW